MEHAQGSPKDLVSSCDRSRRITISCLTARVTDVYTLATPAVSCALHVAEDAREGLSQILHRVLAVLALGLRLAALPMERHPGRRWLFGAAADGRCTAHGARLGSCGNRGSGLPDRTDLFELCYAINMYGRPV